MNIININNFSLSYGNVKLFNNFNFSVEQGHVVGVYGPTGCGKTSLLNKIAEDYISNYKISYVFQDNKLIENISVLKNVLLPIEKLYSKADASGRAEEILSLFNMEHKLQEKTGVLSGGEKQRVNLARAFAYPCNILLMDEPFSAQDDNHRDKLIDLCGKLIKKAGITAVIVSHNIDDLKRLCSNIVRMG